MELTNETIKQKIKDAYPHGVDLVYIDYNDSITDKEQLEELAQTGHMDSFWDHSDWVCDMQYESMEEGIKNVFTEEEQEEIRNNDELKETAKETFEEIDTSDILNDLLKHAPRRYYFYDTGYSFTEDDINTHTQKTINKIARILKIDKDKYQKELRELVINAFYGGNLVILFATDPLNWLNEKGNKEKGYIKFKKYFDICLMDRDQGSGYHLTIPQEITLKFKRENLHDDIGASCYSYTDDVCGLCMGEDCTYSFESKNDEAVKVKENRVYKLKAEKEKQYQETFDKGGCTFGDMKMSKHKDAPYRNEYPCGNKCVKCGTFWID